ncbi:uncharacterized protein YpmB [Flavobacterium sp. 7E]|uniref:hypothetical protein n=1 Tax=Flavobacterium sp. 7E TaxID=2735898 RepID=UPI00156D5BD0|nr:hypothetical protein [Flavobacterium sp. 7E]NRS90005.1 uncharacterized protein YpmB [Flavobacterium sp. 7E]
MKTKHKIILIIITPIFFVIISYLTFIYYFTREPNPIEYYTFSMSYDELEKKLDDKIEQESNANIHRDNTFETRYVTLGKDSAKYFFITNFDKDKSEKYIGAWIEFQAVVDSNSKMLDINYNNKNKYKNRLKIFEDDFIKKLKTN